MIEFNYICWYAYDAIMSVNYYVYIHLLSIKIINCRYRMYSHPQWMIGYPKCKMIIIRYMIISYDIYSWIIASHSSTGLVWAMYAVEKLLTFAVFVPSYLNMENECSCHNCSNESLHVRYFLASKQHVRLEPNNIHIDK